MSETLRIDKLLWYLRFAKSRSVAQGMAEAGHIRLNGRRIDKASCAVRVGDILTLQVQGEVRAARITALPIRRGPASEAAECWELA